jgi:serine/threonine protein phosphatase PrpC
MVNTNTSKSAQISSTQTSPELKPVVWGSTDVGREREGNEDSIYPQSDGHGLKYSPKAETVNRKGYLLIVADGIGGAQAGSEASQWAIRRAVENYYELPGVNIGEDLRAAIIHANASLHQYMQSTNTPDAGCTMSAAIIHNNMLYVANVGDSRVYLIRNGQLYQLTRDHTLTQQKIDQGLIDPAMADSDASRSVLTRSLGALPNVQVDLFSPTPLEPGDQVMLCSDGLYDMVDNEEIARLTQNGTPAKIAKRLITSANRRGGLDNISVIIARIPGKPVKAIAPSPESSNKFSALVGSLAVWQRITVLVLALLTIVVFGLMGWTLGKSLIDRNDKVDISITITTTLTVEVNPPADTVPTSTLTPTPQSESSNKATSTIQPTSQNTTPTQQPTITQKAPPAGVGDRDGDTIPDSTDACPTEVGPVEFNGCPDSDGDGIPDPEDECPTEGLATKPEDRQKPLINGCLDTDQDGFLNFLDVCPSIWAPAGTDGCPIADGGNSGGGEECTGEKPVCEGTLVCSEGTWKCLVVNE